MLKHDRDLRRRIVGKKLQKLRIKAKLAQSDISEILGYSSPQFVSNWENGVSLPTDESIPYLAKYYRVPIESIVDTICFYKTMLIRDYQQRVVKLKVKRKSQK